MSNEWITINKDVFDMRKYESENEFKVFLYFVTHAAVHPTIYKGRVLQRGQLALSITDACAKIGISERNYRTVMKKLTSGTQNDTENDTQNDTQNDTENDTQNDTQIDTEATRQFTVITILKYDDYVSCKDDKRHGNCTQNDTENDTQNDTENDTQNDTQTPSPPNSPKNPPFIQKEKENEKENLSPTPPIKEKEKEKEKASPQPSLKEEKIPHKISSIFCSGKKEESAVFVSEPDGSSTKLKVEKSIEQKRRLLEVHRREFYDSLIPYVQEYGKEMVRDFFDYWSEPNKGRTQMRYEMQPTWSLAMRLATWNKRKKNYVRKSATDEKREANAAVIERLREDALRRLRPMDEEEPLPI